MIPGIIRPPFARTVRDRHLCIKRATPRLVTPSPDSSEDTTPTPVASTTPAPTVVPTPVGGGVGGGCGKFKPGLGQKLCAGDTFKFRGGLGEWKVTVGTAADIDKYMHVDVGAVGSASNGELKISGVPAGV